MRDTIFMVNYLKIMLSRSGNSHLIFLWLFPLSTIGINLRLNSFHTLAYISGSIRLASPLIRVTKESSCLLRGRGISGQESGGERDSATSEIDNLQLIL